MKKKRHIYKRFTKWVCPHCNREMFARGKGRHLLDKHPVKDLKEGGNIGKLSFVLAVKKVVVIDKSEKSKRYDDNKQMFYYVPAENGGVGDPQRYLYCGDCESLMIDLTMIRFMSGRDGEVYECVKCDKRYENIVAFKEDMGVIAY